MLKRPERPARWLSKGGMALQVELIPTGEIIRVVHPHRPCKLVSWDALGWEEGWQCLSGAQQPPLSNIPPRKEVSIREWF